MCNNDEGESGGLNNEYYVHDKFSKLSKYKFCPGISKDAFK